MSSLLGAFSIKSRGTGMFSSQEGMFQVLVAMHDGRHSAVFMFSCLET
jgi:hypothetical protein